MSRRSRALDRVTGIRRARNRGSVMPFVAVSAIFLLGSVGICIDLMRDFQTVNQLEFAAQSASLYGLSLATNNDGSYSVQNAQTNITNAINNASSSSWNVAQSGPVNGVWSDPVTFQPSNISFVNNPNQSDSNEFFVQLTAQRTGSDALTQFFLPLLYTTFGTANGGTNSKVPLSSFQPYQTVEVIGQPASRIGAGAPLSSTPGTRAADLVKFAVLPIAISNQQFAGIAQTQTVGTQVTVDFVSSKQPTGAAGHIQGCLTNPTASTNGGGNFYGTASSDSDIDQLEGLLNYFGASSPQTTLSPAVVEAGSRLSAFDPAAATFANRQSEIAGFLTQLPTNRYYIVPVLVSNPSFGTGNAGNVVAGFARLQLHAFTVNKGSLSSVTFILGESVPVRNASSATGASSVYPGTLLPAPVAPFLPRAVDSSSGGMSARPVGVVFAPAVSPRRIPAQQIQPAS